MPTPRIPAFIVVSVLAVGACSAGASSSPSTAAPSAAASLQASSTGSPAPAQTSENGVTVGTTSTTLGTFLVGPNGKTLYLFEADTTSKSTCSGACAQGWPPLITNGPPVAQSGVKQSLLSTSQRGDGAKQVVYNGHPLYYFSGDSKAGDTLGEGSTAFGAGWDVISPAGTKIEKPGG